MADVGLRVAIRTDGGQVIAYLAPTDSMEGAIKIATIRLDTLEEDGGTSGQLYSDWVDALGRYANRLASRATGVPVEKFQSVKQAPPPEG
ncbi:MAG TPA: hypothetical protein VNJ70_17765 [Thermoanaerobaculia bacterium]|nr:hypothetical protein [Thermoanaerobaculia bacterium]